ncbi:MAG TPA: site-specific integrase [Albitalea sp.]|uniref:tyrosine-type recombinase/integrase n=1 Tax=Piscinibacter sp. TaxID=1903157 RepID=UPI002ED13E16
MLNTYLDHGVNKPFNVWVRNRKAADGERYSVLVTGSGAPLFYSNVFLTSMRRAIGLAASTLTRDAQALAHLLVWADRAGIDLDARFAAGAFLTPTEVLAYARAAKQYLGAVRAKRQPGLLVAGSPCQARSVERFRAGPTPSERGVGTASAEFRLWLAEKYLDWLVDAREPWGISQEELERREQARQRMRNALQAQQGSVPSSPTEPREGLSEEQQWRLRDVIRPDSQDNPWSHPFVRVRNQALVELLLGAGPRHGEALKQRTEHVNMSRLEIRIVRSPDDPADDRRTEPNVKRLGRAIPIEEPLASYLFDYINDWRSQIPGTEKSPFLFLSRSGDPLSQESVQKIFRTLRSRIPELPQNLSAHLLRHTWNDNYSLLMDRNRVPEAKEVRTRSYLMGWKESSGTAARYTRRSTRERADRFSRQMQKDQQTARKKGNHEGDIN